MTKAASAVAVSQAGAEDASLSERERVKAMASEANWRVRIHHVHRGVNQGLIYLGVVHDPGRCPLRMKPTKGDSALCHTSEGEGLCEREPSFEDFRSKSNVGSQGPPNGSQWFILRI